MFVDRALISVKAGDGGRGCHSFYRDRLTRYPRPDGGDGGKGGDLIFTVDLNVQTLLDFHYRRHFKAERGAHGSGKGKRGRDGGDLRIPVPPGTLLRDARTQELLVDLKEPGQWFLAARGGLGGLGNLRAREAFPGRLGESREIELELKLLADVGIVGFPNAGKSSLLSRLSRAHPKIGPYPFTTKAPELGAVVLPRDVRFTVAEVPGLIEGAHEGRGLGDQFLRHIERTNLLIHLVDVGSEGLDPVQSVEVLNRELQAYSPQLAGKPQILCANKIDLSGAKKQLALLSKHYKTAAAVSCKTGQGLADLRRVLAREISKMKRKGAGDTDP